MNRSKKIVLKSNTDSIQEALFEDALDELQVEKTKRITTTIEPVSIVESLPYQFPADSELLPANYSEVQVTKLPEVDVIKKLLKKIVKVDFHLALNSASIKDKNLIYAVVNEVLKVAERSEYPLYLHQASCYIYNEKYYQVISSGDIATLLKCAAIKMGIPECDACYFAFQQQLLKQFYSAVPVKGSQNGDEQIVINLENTSIFFTDTGFQVRPHSKDNFITYRLPFAYDPNATARKFQEYLNKVVPDEAQQKILSEFLAYALLPNLKLEKVLVLVGKGANGKSVFFDIANGLFGNNNVSNYSLQSLTDKTGYQRADLRNKLINYASEISTSLNTTIFKQLASGEPLGVRAIYQPPTTLTTYAKLIFNCNELPLAENTEAYFRRILLIPFNITIAPEERDVELAKKIIAAELPGVFNWVLQGMERLLTQRRFTYSNIADKMLEQYKNESDTVKIYLNENELEPHSLEKQSLKALYENYRAQCLKDGYRAVNKGLFKKGLEDMGFVIERRNSGNMVFIGKRKCI